MSKRVFYVIYIRDERIQVILDAIRFLANPEEKAQAHITVRGPYTQKQSLPKVNKDIRGAKVLAEGVGTFFNSRQNTVFVKCHADALRRVWKKNDFGFNPHITLYDGPSRQFAEALLECLSRVQIQFSFLVDELRPLTSRKGQFAIWLDERFDRSIVDGTSNMRLEASEVRRLPGEFRLSLIESLALDLDAIREKRYLYGEQGGYCNCCGRHLKMEGLEIDHIVPIADGGSNHVSNRQLLCVRCQSFKTGRTQEKLFSTIKGEGREFGILPAVRNLP